MKETIHHVLVENLTGVRYDTEECTDLSKKIADEIKVKLKGNLQTNVKRKGAFYNFCLMSFSE